MLVSGARTTSLVVGQTLHALQLSGKEGIRPILNPFSDRCVSRPTEHQAILLQRLGLHLPAALEFAAV